MCVYVHTPMFVWCVHAHVVHMCTYTSLDVHGCGVCVCALACSLCTVCACMSVVGYVRTYVRMCMAVLPSDCMTDV